MLHGHTQGRGGVRGKLCACVSVCGTPVRNGMCTLPPNTHTHTHTHTLSLSLCLPLDSSLDLCALRWHGVNVSNGAIDEWRGHACHHKSRKLCVSRHGLWVAHDALPVFSGIDFFPRLMACQHCKQAAADTKPVMPLQGQMRTRANIKTSHEHNREGGTCSLDMCTSVDVCVCLCVCVFVCVCVCVCVCVHAIAVATRTVHPRATVTDPMRCVA